ncbi:MAG: PP2C family protein-serine/threonine phosphatase [Bacteroidota bacterium]
MNSISISDLEVKDAFHKSTERFHVITCWLGIILNIAWFASDFFVLPEYWFTFLIFRIAVSGITVTALILKNWLRINIYFCLFILVIGISIQNAYMWSVMDLAHLQKHTFAYIALFIGVGMLVLWEIKLSIIILIATVISNVFFYKLNSTLTVDEFLINGALLTLSVAVFSVFLIRTRYRLTLNEIRIRLQLGKSKQIIEQKHEEVLHQKKEITDSINYAKSIQRAFLPTEDQFRSYFKESFIFFQPKDIVSGDFYWVYEKENILFYATADCTGHGVPGGFMTMLGLSFLDDVIVSKATKNPAEALNLMRDKIVNTLKQSGNIGENKDGMDIIICCIDKVKSELVYASANNPLYLIRENELQIYKGDKQPCGIHHENKPFTSYTIKIKPNDCIYTFTDGFADQFGGTNRKKFRYKQFEDLLLKNVSDSLIEQKNKLTAAFEAWKGDLEQVDDILVIGLKI